MPPGIWTPAALQDAFRRAAARAVVLTLTDNRARWLTVKTDGPDVLLVRAHRKFLDAPPEVVDAAGRFAAGDAAAGAAVRAWLEGVTARPVGQTRVRTVRPSSSDPSGRHHDLPSLWSQLNERYLQNRSRAEVAWGRRERGRRTRSIRFGWYDPTRCLIVMNRRLDRPDVPESFVSYVLFHEMLHEVLGIGERADGKRDIHGRLFRLMEKTFPDYDEAIRFERVFVRQELG